MDFPFGHHRRHDHHHHNPDETHEPVYPPPGTGMPLSPPPPYPPYPSHAHDPQRAMHDFPPPHNHHHHHHNSHENPVFNPPPAVTEVHHVAHETPFSHDPYHSHPHPNSSSIIHHHHHPRHGDGSSGYLPSVPLPQGQDVRVFCQAEAGYSLTIRDGSVILARSNPSDEYQHWIKDEMFSIRVKDEEGFPSFALVNKATGQALQHSIGATQPVRLTPYRPNVLDQSILWTLSRDVGHGFRTIRMVNNIRLNLDAFNGDKNHGGVHDGTVAVLWEWKKGDNQRWKLVPYCGKNTRT